MNLKTTQLLFILKIILLVTFTILVATVFFVTQHDMQLRKKIVLSQQITNLSNTYKVSMHRFETIADSINSTVINREDVLELLYRAKHTIDNDSLIPLREELFKKIKPHFDNLKKVGVIITLFSFENNKTFLRVHKPKKFNDDLSKVRYSFKYVNENKKIIRGLEEGKIMHAFRNIYPIFYKGEYLGSVDIAFSSHILKEHMEDLHKTESHFIINKNVFMTNIWEMNDMVNYNPSIEHKDFLQNKQMHISETEKNLNKKLKKKIYQNIKHNQAFSLEESGGIVSFLPVKNIKDKKTVAYLVSYEKSAYLKNLMKENILLNVLSFIVLMIIHIVIYISIKNRSIDKESKSREVKNYLDIAQVLIMALDNNKNVIMINQKGADIVGYKKEDIIGKNWIDNFVPKRLKDNTNNVWDKVTKQNNLLTERENYILTKSGEERLLLWKNSQLLDNDGNVIGILASGEDITEKRENEKQLLLHTKQAQMGEMISMIAHQWRQPLGAIASTSIDMKMQSELELFDLGQKQEAEKYETYINDRLDNINTFVENLTTTIDDFRNFYKQDKKTVSVKLEDVILKSLNINKASLINDNIKIVEEYNSKQKIELYDSEMMQVILNILKNAQDNFSDKQIKKPYIKITTEKNTISICDNGGGIPDDIIEKIFDPYFSTKKDLNGTGLGLYMSKIIVKEHHSGNIIVKNIEDTKGIIGVCFKIELGIIL